MSDSLDELRKKFKLYRIFYPLTQKELADKSGVSVRSISRFENGEDIGLSSFYKLLKALNLDKNIDMLIPDQRKRPSYYLDENINRKRYKAKKVEEKTEIKWGDEE